MTVLNLDARIKEQEPLDGFVAYACEEARKQAEKSTRCACITDNTVYGWAVHYFEEDSIEGTLYNPDGTEYKPPKPKYDPKAVPIVTTKPQPKPPSLFDLMQPEIPTVENLEEAQTDDEDVSETIEPDSENEQNIEPSAPPKIVGSTFYRHYLKIQSKYPDRIVLYRSGDFYEVLGDNAAILARELDLTLTRRDCGIENRVPMIGFPYYSADAFIRKITDRGYRLAVVEHLDAPKLLEKEPELTDVIDPETGEVLTEEDMRRFDGDDIDHKDVLCETNGDCRSERTNAFDNETLSKLSEILGDVFILR